MRRRPKGEWNRSGPFGLRWPDSDELVRAHSRSAADQDASGLVDFGDLLELADHWLMCVTI
ncbi:MAG: hypothetical protein GX455_06800 [Phycisphaerae bacterium]|nr:hypothetical protein [Phycisphaerae bacterium]